MVMHTEWAHIQNQAGNDCVPTSFVPYKSLHASAFPFSLILRILPSSPSSGKGKVILPVNHDLEISTCQRYATVTFPMCMWACVWPCACTHLPPLISSSLSGATHFPRAWLLLHPIPLIILILGILPLHEANNNDNSNSKQLSSIEHLSSRHYAKHFLSCKHHHDFVVMWILFPF